MKTVTLSSKGQFVIPKSIRIDAQLSAGSQLEVSSLSGEIRLGAVATHKTSELSQVAACLFKHECKRPKAKYD